MLFLQRICGGSSKFCLMWDRREALIIMFAILGCPLSPSRASLNFETKTEFFDKSSKNIDILPGFIKPK